MELLLGVEARAPKGEMGSKLVYECALEGMAGLILKSRRKALCCPKTLGIFPLIFEMMDGPGTNATETNQAVLEAWDKHLPNLGKISSFGCNYIHQEGKHRFLCLFK
ncbi:hypothetical protein Y032_0015g2878 [Ancylostoma ceylanicum]|nr:hypothetical protein Y032_0015g2878 [Ancylostoma ceylanicum]